MGLALFESLLYMFVKRDSMRRRYNRLGLVIGFDLFRLHFRCFLTIVDDLLLPGGT